MGLIVGVTIVSAGVILFVMLPLLRGDWATMERSDDEVTEVDARKQAALRGLRDAEYDYQSGKIDREDYQIIKSDLARQVLQALDEEGAAVVVADAPTPGGGEGERSKGSTSKKSKRAMDAHANSDGDDLEVEIARVRKGLAEGRTCPACGHLNVKASRFCTSCGGGLGTVTAATHTQANIHTAGSRPAL